MINECPKCHTKNPPNTQFCGQCAAPLNPSADIFTMPTKTMEKPKLELERGSIFADRYEIIEELGEGGMGKVYRVEDRRLQEEVALKLIKPEISLDKRTIERFSDELRYSRKIAHRNVCKMYDLGEENGTHYITMEYVSGESLKGMIKMMGQMSAGQAIFIAKQVCEGMSEAHRLGIVHRDLKPGNIMLDREGHVRIMDFGIARSLEAKGITKQGMMIGTPDYMSPEQVEGKEADPRSDVYAFGVILFEMMTGRLPFEGESSLSTAFKHKIEKPPDPRKVNPEVSFELSRLILKCLEKNREQRYQNMAELLEGLEQIEKGITTGERVIPKKTSVAATIFKKKAGLVWIVVAAVIVLVGLTVLSDHYLSKRGPLPLFEPKMLVVLPFENMGSPEDDYFAEGLTEELTSRLSAVHGLGIISRTSSKQYKNTTKTAKQIGEELGVDYILEGTVRWDRTPDNRGRVRVTPQLIRVSDDTHLWSEVYDRFIEDIFSVQSEIAEEVTKKLDITVLEPERRALMAKPTDNLEAYDNYLRAYEYWGRGYIHQSLEENERAVASLERAIELDSDFLLAYLLLYDVHNYVYNVGLDRSDERLAKAKNALDGAVALEPELPEVKMRLGNYLIRTTQDYDRGLEIYESVQRTRPNLSPSGIAFVQMRLGRWEDALANYQKAFKLNPRSWEVAHLLGRVYAWIWEYDKSEEWFERALSIRPELYYSKLGIARLPMLRGDLEQARARLERLPPHVLTDYNWYLLGMLERNYQEVLDRLATTPFKSFQEAQFYIPIDLARASVYHAMGETALARSRAESARIELEKLISERSEDTRLYAPLGLTLAYSGRKQDAIREGRRAVNLYPVSKDAFEGVRYVMNLAKIYAVIGEHEQALDQLEFLFSIPCGNNYSVPILNLDPIWDPLRDHPRFQALIETPPWLKQNQQANSQNHP